MFTNSNLPGWLQPVIEAIPNLYELGLPGRIGWSAYFGREGWEIYIYPEAVEMVGGPADGEELIPSPRAVRLSEVIDLFDGLPSIDWCHSWKEITEISVEGKVQGNDLWLHFMEEPPEDVECTSRFDWNTGSFEEKASSDSE